MKRRIVSRSKGSITSSVSVLTGEIQAPALQETAADAGFAASAGLSAPAAEAPGERAAPASASTPLMKYWFWIVLLLVVWQPLELGFYMDDWGAQAETARQGAAFSAERFEANHAVDPTRPGLVVIRYVFSSLLGDRPLLWQLAMLLVNALVAYWLARAAQAIVGRFEGAGAGAGMYGRAVRGSSWNVALGASLLWLLLPWSTSSQFWTMLLPAEVIVALFAYLLTRIFGCESPTLVSLSIDCFLYFWICVSYEAFYGQFLAIVLLCVALAVLGKMQSGAALLNFISLAVAQALAVWWFLGTATMAAEKRGIEADWQAQMLGNFGAIFPGMWMSFSETGWVLCAGALVLLGYAGWILWRSRERWAEGRGRLGFGLIVLTCVFGAAISVVSFSLGARPFRGIGVENRAFFLVSFWMVLLIALAALALPRLARPGDLKVLGRLALTCGVILGAAHTVRALDWASAWTQAQEVLRNVPVEQMEATEPDAAILLVNPMDVNGAPIFQVPWDINHAVPLMYPMLANRKITIYSRWNGPMSWDGNSLTYPGQAPVLTSPHVYLWIPAKRTFRRAERPFQIEQGLSVRELP